MTSMAVFHYVLCMILVLAVVHAQKVLNGLQSHPSFKLLYGEDCCNCGHGFSNRIIGGHKAQLGQFPWMARIGYLADPSTNYTLYFCGGSLISKRYVLTAAHCGPGYVGMPFFQVQLGEHNTENDPDCKDGVCAPKVQEVLVEGHTCYPGLEKINLLNDICLIRLAKPVVFSDYVSPICLPTYDVFKNKNFDGTTMEVAGWGITDFFVRQKSEDLLYVKLKVKPFENCKLTYRVQFNKTLISNQTCAGGEIGKDSCGGDSGGPLMVPLSMGAPPRYFIFGVVSYGQTLCSSSEAPGIYTKVSEYMEWILNNIKK